MTSRRLIAPALGVGLVAILVLSARAARASFSPPPVPPAPPLAGAMTLAASVPITADVTVALTEIRGLRSAQVGNFALEPDPHAPGRVFVDTTDDGAILGTPDQQRLRLAVLVTPATLNPSAYEVRWELRDPDDPADLAEIDASPAGGDNTGTPHERAPFWFVQADHAISAQVNRTPVDESTVIGEARTAITSAGGNLVSSVYLRYGDDGGDNYRVRAVVRLKTPGVDLDSDESGVLTVWRRRPLSVYAMTKPNDDVQVQPLGSSPGAFALCITAGPNARSDTMVLGGDDIRRGENVHAGPNGIVETTANSGGNSFDPEVTLALLRGTYALAAPDQLAYLDWEASNEQLDRPYVASMTREDVRDYMHAQTDFVHSGARKSLLGVHAIETIAGNANYPPHCGVSVGLLKKTAPEQLPKTNVHELGHLLIGAFESVEDFHNLHSQSQLCGYRQGLHPPQLCSRHASRLRDRVARAYGTAHSYFESVLDSAPSR